MLFGCILLLLTCEQIQSYNFLLNDGTTIRHLNASIQETIIVSNTTLKLTEIVAVQYPYVFYVGEFADVATVYQYDMESQVSTAVATNFLSISGLAVLHPTLYVLEMGDFNNDPNGRITAVSITTGRQKVLLRINDIPRALFMDDINGFLYYGLPNSSVMRFDIASSEVSIVTSYYDVWATGLCVENNILYIYNSKTRYAHNITSGNAVDEKNVGDWNTFAVPGSSLCIMDNVEWSDDGTLSISTKNTTTTLNIATTSSLHTLLLFHNNTATPPDLAKCQDCDVCLGVEMECGCRFGAGVHTHCRAAPKDYLLLTQMRALSLLDRTEPNKLHRLHVNTNEFWMRDVVLNSRSGTIFWLESVFTRTSPSLNMEAEKTRIMKMKLHGSDTPQVVYYDKRKDIDTLALDEEDGMLYWLVSKANILVAAKMSCTTELCYKTILVNQDLEQASQLHVSGKTGYMVYVLNNEQIIRRELNGGDPQIILSANILHISCIALSGQSVYILTKPDSSHDGSIISLPLAGGEQRVVYKQNSEFIPLSFVASFPDILFIVSEFKRTVVEVNLSSQTSEPILEDFRGLKSIASNSADVSGYCAKNNGGCDHMCFSLPNTNHRCGCADGFILLADNSTCQEPPLVYLSVGSWIQRFHPFPVSGNSTLENVLFHSGAEIVAIDYFEEKECLVWIDAKENRILKTYLKGEQLPTDNHLAIVVDGLVKPTDISVDWVSNTMYWSDQLRDSISMVSLDGSFRKVVVEHALAPTSLVVYPANGTMYWVGWEPSTAVIRSSAMDGSNVTTLLSSHAIWPTDITIDYQNSRVVWADANDSLVVSCDLDGSDVRYILGTRTMRYPVSLEVWHGYTYWADKHMSTVYVAEGSNSYDVESVMNMLVNVTDIVLSHAGKQGKNSMCYPGNGNCSHVCVPTSAITRVCMCPVRMFLGQDSLTCQESAQQMIGVDHNPYLLSVHSPPAMLSNQILSSAVKIAVHYQHQSIYWLDNDRSSIKKVHVNGTGYKTNLYKGTYNATDIRVDWMGGNIYWTEADSMSLKCVTLNGKYEKLIRMTKAAPMFLLIDPPRSILFWMECDNNNGTLYQSAMSGSNVRQILNTTKCPESMEIAREARSIYWTIEDYLYQYHYDIEQASPPRGLPFQTPSGNEIFCSNLAESSTKCPPVPTPKIVWVEETLFVRREREEDGRRRREMVGIDTLVDRIIDLGNSSCVVAFSPLDTGFSECHINNGGCTHFCYYEESGVTCGCPAEQTLLSNNKTCTKLEVKCEDGEFRCGSGECISEEFVCSLHSECLDSSDEADCDWCPSSEFSCDDHTCIPSSSVCDGIIDCDLDKREDENPSLCSYNCYSSSRYRCKGTGVCLPIRMKCNGVKECEHGDDEKRCPRQKLECDAGEFRCESEGSKEAICIQQTWLCDGHADCPGGEDEQDCPGCDLTTQFDCGNDMCISLSDVCDGVIHCQSDGLDEMNCEVCKEGQKECENGQCRAANRWCDRTPDCSDRSDERNCNYTIVQPKSKGKQNHIAPTLIIVFVSLLMSVIVVGILYKFNILPMVRSTYKELTQSSNKTVETNVCVTTNTYSELETTVCSSDGAWQRRNKSLDHYETITNSSISSCLKPINTQNPYERFGIVPVQSTTDVSVGDGPPPSIASGGYSSGPGPSSRAPSARSRALSARSRATSVRSRVPIAYHVNNNVVWDDHINSVSDYEQNYLSDNYQSEFSVGFPGPRPHGVSRSLAAPGCGTPITTDNDD